MKVKSTMTYNGEPIADCEWTLDDKARTTQQALAAMSIEDHLRAQLKIEHKIITDEPCDECKKEEEDSTEDFGDIPKFGSAKDKPEPKKKKKKRKKNESETKDEQSTHCEDSSEGGQSLDSPLQDQTGGELDRMEDWSTLD